MPRLAGRNRMKIFTVSEVVSDVKSGLESMYADISVEGEISSLNRHSSGHGYFSLKDSGAQISAVMFREEFGSLRFRPENGLKVVVRGRLTVYPPQGRFQIVLKSMEPQGKGALQLAFEQLKTRLAQEGLFDPARKRPIPTLPSWIGLITSPDGAALHDILTVLRRRTAGVRVLLHPARVQGEGAAREIAAALERLNREFPALDVILVGRGGGSLEDLWAFNEESLARAIVASHIPVISCVGHETDFTIADFVADLRAPTPSAAAELVCAARTELRIRVQALVGRLRSRFLRQLDASQARLERAASTPFLRRPDALIDDFRQMIDEHLRRLTQAGRMHLERRARDFQLASQKLQLLSPLATLSRGFAVVWKLPGRTLLKAAAAVAPQDPLEIQLEKGRVYAQVERTEI